MFFCAFLLSAVFASSCKNSTCFTSCVDRKESYGDVGEIEATWDCMRKCYNADYNACSGNRCERGDYYPWLTKVIGTNRYWEPLFSCNGTTATSVWPWGADEERPDFSEPNCDYVCGPCNIPKGRGPRGFWLMDGTDFYKDLNFTVAMNFSDVNYTVDLAFEFASSSELNARRFPRGANLNLNLSGFAFECKNEPYKLKPSNGYYNMNLIPREQYGLQLLFVKDGVVSECLRSNFAKHGIEMLEHPIWLDRKSSNYWGTFNNPQGVEQIWMNYGVVVPYDWNVTNKSQEGYFPEFCGFDGWLYRTDCQNDQKTFYVHKALEQPTQSPTPFPTRSPGIHLQPADHEQGTGWSKTTKAIVFGVSGILLWLVVIVALVFYGHRAQGKKTIFDATCGFSDALVQTVPNDDKETPGNKDEPRRTVQEITIDFSETPV